MIKFFRKIRQNLLSEGKTVKYLKYAIGEIILVVIGILIALQINNWNESKKNNKLVSNYKKGLIENLKKDSLNVSDVLFRVREDLEKIEEYEERVSKSKKPLDTIVKIARYEFNFIIALNYNFENDTYQVLNSTGHLGLFDNDLIKELNELNNLQKKSIFATDKSYNNYSQVLLKYSEKYPFSFKSNLIQNGSIASDKIWNNISQTNHATEFNALVITKSDCYRLELLTLPVILEKTTKLLEKLQKK